MSPSLSGLTPSFCWNLWFCRLIQRFRRSIFTERCVITGTPIPAGNWTTFVSCSLHPFSACWQPNNSLVLLRRLTYWSGGWPVTVVSPLTHCGSYWLIKGTTTAVSCGNAYGSLKVPCDLRWLSGQCSMMPSRLPFFCGNDKSFLPQHVIVYPLNPSLASIWQRLLDSHCCVEGYYPPFTLV